MTHATQARTSARAQAARAFQAVLSATPRAACFDADVADYTFDTSDAADYVPAGWRYVDA